jgi:hypothetical protein
MSAGISQRDFKPYAETVTGGKLVVGEKPRLIFPLLS